MTQSIFRVGGGYTSINFKGKALLYVDLVRETAPRPVAAPQAIQPLDSPYPIEIAFPAALEAGTLEITFREQWGNEVWAQLGGSFQYASDLLGVFQAQLSDGNTLPGYTITKTITSPSGSVRTITYNGCVVVNVMIDETVNIGTMTFPKSVQFMYLNRTETQSVWSTSAAQGNGTAVSGPTSTNAATWANANSGSSELNNNGYSSSTVSTKSN